MNTNKKKYLPKKKYIIMEKKPLPQEQITEPNYMGHFQKINYQYNDKEEIVKIIRTMKKVPTKVIERKNNWVKFGPDDKFTYPSEQLVFMTGPPFDDDEDEKDIPVIQKNHVVKCKHCGEDHWSRFCQNKKDNSENEANILITETPVKIPKPISQPPIVYTENYDERVIQITNLGPDVTEDDIHELFSQHAKILLLSIVKEYNSNISKIFSDNFSS